MAKFTPGPMVAAVSGKQGGTIFSRNRYGAYTRYHAIPVQPGTVYQLNQRGLIGTFSQAFQNLTDEQRQAWRTWAQANPVVDSLGQQQVLTGHAAYVKINTRIYRMDGSFINDPPVAAPPQSIQLTSGTAFASTQAVSVVFEATPLLAGQHAIVDAAVVFSPAKLYVKNLYKQVLVTEAAEASPISCGDEIVERFGVLKEGQIIHIRARVGDEASGLYSAPTAIVIEVAAAP